MELRKINSSTKYPSILTYHQLGDKGRLTKALTEDKRFQKSDEILDKYSEHPANVQLDT